MAKARQLVIILLLVMTTGLHWIVLQSAAWAAMLAKNLQTCSASEAVSDTFDGKHPCCMCKAIAAGKKSEKQSDTIASLKKVEFPPMAETFVLVAPAWVLTFSSPGKDLFADSCFLKPPVPPPRRLFI